MKGTGTSPLNENPHGNPPRWRGGPLGPWAVGWFALVATLSVIAAAGNISAAVDDTGIVRVMLPRFTTGAAVCLATIGLATVAGVLLIVFARRRAGYFLLAGAALLAFGINLHIGIPLSEAAAGLLAPVISWAFIRSRWHLLA